MKLRPIEGSGVQHESDDCCFYGKDLGKRVTSEAAEVRENKCIKNDVSIVSEDINVGEVVERNMICSDYIFVCFINCDSSFRKRHSGIKQERKPKTRGN